jgi:hypothetical protein
MADKPKWVQLSIAITDDGTLPAREPVRYEVRVLPLLVPGPCNRRLPDRHNGICRSPGVAVLSMRDGRRVTLCQACLDELEFAP